jgi:glycosyltransferase involved in cell wall biosynthesis
VIEPSESAIRVLVVTSEWPSDDRPAAGVFVRSQVDALRRRGLDVDVFSFRGSRAPLRYLRARRSLRARLERNSFDLVHAHFGQSGLVVGSTTVPLVVTFHGSDLLGIVSRRGRYTLSGRILRVLSLAVARRADRVIVVSRALAGQLPDRVDPYVIPLPVDVSVFGPRDRGEARRTLGLPLDRPLVLFNGNPDVPAKRYALARGAMHLLPVDAQLITVQDQPRSVVSLYMNACDALLVTSRHEGGPMMVKEALACGLPVVSVDVGDVAEWLTGVGECVVCADDSPATIADALERVLSAAARVNPRTAIHDGDEAALTDRVVAVYHEAIAERRVHR